MNMVHIKFLYVFLSYFLFGASLKFFSFKSLKNIHLELAEYFPIFWLLPGTMY